MSPVAEVDHGVIDREEIDSQKAAGEFMFLGLRMTEWNPSRNVSYKIWQNAGRILSAHRNLEREAIFLEEQDGYLKLTAKGLMLANSIFVEFM